MVAIITIIVLRIVGEVLVDGVIVVSVIIDDGAVSVCLVEGPLADGFTAKAAEVPEDGVGCSHLQRY